MIIAANFLHNEGMLQLLSARFACEIINKKDVDEIRILLGIENDLTEDQIAQIEKERGQARDTYLYSYFDGES